MRREILRLLFISAVLSGLVPASNRPVDASDAAITRGRVIDPAEFPSVGELEVEGTDTCTATLIGPRVIVTAAHCSDGKRANARIALQNRKLKLKLYPSRFYDQAKYEQKEIVHDISLGLLDRAVDLPAMVLGEPPAVDLRVALLGFGYTENPKDDPGILRLGFNRISFVKPEAVAFMIGPLTETELGSAGMPGDSGGPVLSLDRVIGVMSLTFAMRGTGLAKGQTAATKTASAESDEVFTEFERQFKVKICRFSGSPGCQR